MKRAHEAPFTWAGERQVDDLLHVAIYRFDDRTLLSESYESHAVANQMLTDLTSVLDGYEVTKVDMQGGLWEGERTWVVRILKTDEHPTLYVYVRLATLTERDRHIRRSTDARLASVLDNLVVS